MSLFSQLQTELRRMSTALSTSKAGQRGRLQAQVRKLRTMAKNTPEYRALRAKCQKEVDALNAPYVMMNIGNWQYQANPDILTGRCRIQQENLETAGGGD